MLSLQGRHQRYHRYVPLSDFIPGPENPEADDTSRLHHLSDTALLDYFNKNYPQTLSWRLWQPTPTMLSSVIGALRKMPSDWEFQPTVPHPPTDIGPLGSISAPLWPSTHSYKSSKTQWSSSKSTYTDTVPALSHRAVALSAHAPLRMPYVALAKRSLHWGPQTHAKHSKATWISALPANYHTTRNRILLPTA